MEDERSMTETAEELSETETSDTEFSGEGAEREDEGAKSSEKGTKSARWARSRRAAEQKMLAETRNAASIEATGGKNHFTGEDIKDTRDIDEYLLMKDIEKRGGDPVMDYAKYSKEKLRESDAETEKNRETEEFIERDRQAFIAKYPDVDISELVNDEGFRIFAGDRAGKVPLGELYEDYEKLGAKLEERAKRREAQRIANSRATPGALSSSDVAEPSFYTPEQVRAMTLAQVKENYDKIRASMKNWK